MFVLVKTMDIFWLSVILSSLMLRCGATVKSCTNHGVTRHHGESWISDDGCNACDCTDSGADCQTWKNCDNQFNHELGQPGVSLCRYGNDYKAVGETWVADDRCNTCTCTSHGMVCSYNPCKNAGFDKPKPDWKGRHFMDCSYKRHYYTYGAHFMAEDGCNTCMCIMPGNFATFPKCTTTRCNNVIG